MKAKIASKILNNHISGKPSKLSSQMLLEAVKMAESQGLKGPFELNKVAIFNPNEPFAVEENPEFRAHDEKASLGPEIDNFVKAENKHIPYEIASGVFVQLGPNGFGGENYEKYKEFQSLPRGEKLSVSEDELNLAIIDLKDKIKIMEEDEALDYSISDYKSIEDLIVKLESVKLGIEEDDGLEEIKTLSPEDDIRF